MPFPIAPLYIGGLRFIKFKDYAKYFLSWKLNLLNFDLWMRKNSKPFGANILKFIQFYDEIRV